MSDESADRGEHYRQRAQALMRLAENATDEETKRTWHELATSWFELAKRAEELEKTRHPPKELKG